MRHAADAVGIGEQAVVQIVEVQDRELVDSALPAANQQKKSGTAEKLPS